MLKQVLLLLLIVFEAFTACAICAILENCLCLEPSVANLSHPLFNRSHPVWQDLCIEKELAVKKQDWDLLKFRVYRAQQIVISGDERVLSSWVSVTVPPACEALPKCKHSSPTSIHLISAAGSVLHKAVKPSLQGDILIDGLVASHLCECLSYFVECACWVAIWRSIPVDWSGWSKIHWVYSPKSSRWIMEMAPSLRGTVKA